MSEETSTNAFRTHYEQNKGNLLVAALSAIDSAAEKGDTDMVPLGDFKRSWDRIGISNQQGIEWRTLSDLYAAGVIDTEKQGNINFIVSHKDSIGPEILDEIPDVEEYKDSLVHDNTYSDQMKQDWITYEIGDQEVNLPRFPVEFFEEHFSRNGYEAKIHDKPEEDPVARMLVAEDESTWGDMERTAFVFNQMKEKNDFIKLSVDVYRPDFQDESFYSERNARNWLGRVKNQELEPLIGDIENIYQQAYDAVTGQHEIFSDEVEDLRDIRDRLNDQPQRSNDLSIADVIDRSRESNDYFGDSGADRLRAPLAEYLNFGRNGKVAPVSAQYSNNKRESGKVDRGELLEDMYFEALESFSEAFYDDFRDK
jgi:hypothetical protein